MDASKAVSVVINQSDFPEVPYFGGDNDWNINMINAPEVWAKGFTGRGVIVAVIDDGFDTSHPDISSNLWVNSDEIPGNGLDDDSNGYIDDINGWNFSPKKPNENNNINPSYAFDENHGTHIAGTIAGLNNGTGVTGIAYNAKIMPLKVTSSNFNEDREIKRNIRTIDLVKAIEYAADNGADIINISLGRDEEYSNNTVIDALKYASDRGIIVVMSAGNSFDDSVPPPDYALTPGYPASYSNNYGISVGAVNQNNAITNFSNRAGSDSSLIHITAPGNLIYSTDLNNSHTYKSGTSMAAPHVSGVIALMLEANPDLTTSEIRKVIATSKSDYQPTGLELLDIQENDTDDTFIFNNDNDNVIELSINDVSEVEGKDANTEFIFTISLSEASTKAITVNYATADDSVDNQPGASATAGEDYTATNGTLEFSPGETEKTITVEVIGDTNLEVDEKFSLNLSNPSNAEISDSQGTGIIINDDDFLTPLDTNINRFQNEDIPGTYLFAGEQESQSIRENFPN
ncbi:MAG: S8 family serine peptidase, partial [Xenococcaceae cyanobacterium MO_188.B19]|nr:S8 family serine peptidase [Xenococcaceae cyanobacterium MO_188.B19]